MCLFQTSFEKEATNMIGQKRIEIAEKTEVNSFCWISDILLDIPIFQDVFKPLLWVNPFKPQKAIQKVQNLKLVPDLIKNITVF